MSKLNGREIALGLHIRGDLDVEELSAALNKKWPGGALFLDTKRV